MSALWKTPPAGRDAAAWLAADLEGDTRWITQFDHAERAGMARVVKAAMVPGQSLLAYRRSDFPFSEAALARIRRAFDEAQHGLGVALIKGLPREGLSPEEFELLTWGIGLHFGVARPQDKQSRYMNKVMDVGTVYRSAGGRGYSSNAELDFHVDGSDVVLLSCYNQAPVGGDSMCSSAVTAFRILREERPDLAAVLQEPFRFSRQGEQGEGKPPVHVNPVYAEHDGGLFCFWNRNRVVNATKLPDAPPLNARQQEAIDLLDAILRRPQVMYLMRLEPGDLQILSNYTALHSRTQFQDDEHPAKKRMLFRLWLAMPDAPALPDPWAGFFGSTSAGTVRGGVHGFQYDDSCIAFDARQAGELGMRFDPDVRP
ncbi:TauD/TfdA family dioxygenase [Ramlibacter tataouinensis]|uniref:Gamma-butyrobetaine, 2-oxoglutarate dioxygenase (Gamma-butyrobetaine hydroxylase)-like protein n=1 Tax=Ramlibacter tataouinensis (strain ATCC BAA-407 / DSM 14655 / LMG 21543 / TTB310) TaxID=365046 RepID=F5XZ89_RAMTT|nr:TauD/TfdA family dioxygenase [Ramlibacter tataouinensis]AEG93259.1 gamma-butyrobetaine, 2-oxoglutarate dioxygenase (Gamma-butyrobetaine hydroxylase)-like protein [Ramlibacter tataouinensis TTB310]